MCLRNYYLVLVGLFLAFSVIGCSGVQNISLNDSVPEKVALVIGNSSYLHTTPLVNPINDATALFSVLEELGFEVIKGLDLNSQDMQDSLDEFAKKLKKGPRVVLFYYAGHGLQMSDHNYLLPVDMKFDKKALAQYGYIENKSLKLDNVLAVMDQEPSLNLVFLDACRDNPFFLNRGIAGKNKKRNRREAHNDRRLRVTSIQLKRGLAQVKASYSKNMFIAYATQPGNVAQDGSGKNSPFTEALLLHIKTPDLEIRALLTEVRKSVMFVTNDKQIPWDHASLTEKFYFNPIPKTRSIPPPP